MTTRKSEAPQGRESRHKRGEDNLEARWGLIKVVLAAVYYVTRILIDLHR